MTRDVNVYGLQKPGEKYLVLFFDDQRDEALRTLGRWASHPELSFTWYDAAVVSQRIRKEVPDSTNRLNSFT